MASNDTPAETPKLTNVEVLSPGGLPLARPLRFERVGQGDVTRAPAAQGDPVAIERVSQFAKLVRGENDIVGLLAFAIFERHRLEWLDVFEKSCGRLPNNDELNAYVLGESTERRLANYRELAETALAQRRQEAAAEPQAPARQVALTSETPRPLIEPRPAVQRGKWIGGGLAYLIFLAAVAGSCAWFLVHFGVVRM
jgi:hypothetical protein